MPSKATPAQSLKPLPPKPYADFPLRAHASGKWTKKIKGKCYYFGRWDNPDAALVEYESFLRKPEASDSPNSKLKTIATLSLYDASQLFLTAKESKRNEGAIVRRTFEEYLKSSRDFVEFVGRSRKADGLRPQDFNLYRQHLVNKRNLGPVAAGNEVVRVRVLMKWIFDTYYPASRPQFGPDFVRPSRKSLRRLKAEQKSKLLTADVIRRVWIEAGIHTQAIILLGINAAYGPTDVARVPLLVIEDALSSGWLVWPRAKTFVHRECSLWPETIDALERSIRWRVKLSKCESFFTLPNGDEIPSEMGVSLVQGRWKSAKQAARVVDGGFYCLRHTFNTIARQSGDSGAVKMIMGHVDGTISETYDHRIGERFIEDERHIKIQDRVRSWMGFGDAPVS